MVRVGRALKEHRRIMNGPLATYTCGGCGESGLTGIVIREHAERETFPCTGCGNILPMTKLLDDTKARLCVECLMRR